MYASDCPELPGYSIIAIVAPPIAFSCITSLSYLSFHAHQSVGRIHHASVTHQSHSTVSRHCRICHFMFINLSVGFLSQCYPHPGVSCLRLTDFSMPAADWHLTNSRRRDASVATQSRDKSFISTGLVINIIIYGIRRKPLLPLRFLQSRWWCRGVITAPF